jgi:hypothetical protein
MVIRVIRQPSGVDTTFGVMFIDGYFQCFTLENSHKIIPAGSYPISLYDSPHNRRVVPLLHNVPNRSEIEIHVANYYHDLEGCIGVGADMNDTQLVSSTVAFVELMSKIGNNQVSINIENWA